jgi:putative spermidine/putrescine transport system ATP-binding protein
MNGGRVEQIAPPDAAYDDPASPFVASFLGKTNLLPGSIAADGAARTLRIDEARWVLDGAAAPGPVTAAVRPEKIAFANHGLAGTVRTRVFLGTQWLFQVDTPAGPVTVIRQNSGDAVPQEGELVALAWRPRDMRIMADGAARQ